VKALVCPHCHTRIAEAASICRGCGAEVVRGATRRERALIGLAFVIAAIPVLAIILRALEIARGVPPLPSPKDDAALLYFLGLIGFFVAAFLLGRVVAGRLFWRSQVRFFRTYRHQ
jgi:hypothetical protein